jgi:heavy metal efflux system protein
MIEHVLTFSVQRRLAVMFLTIAAACVGVWSLSRLPIDAVPDITNNQVQINGIAPALSPGEIEKQVTFPIETALAGTPGLDYTRSFSRNGFSQVTAVFSVSVRSPTPGLGILHRIVSTIILMSVIFDKSFERQI